jgi:hypothetical protein
MKRAEHADAGDRSGKQFWFLLRHPEQEPNFRIRASREQSTHHGST